MCSRNNNLEISTPVLITLQGPTQNVSSKQHPLQDTIRESTPLNRPNLKPLIINSPTDEQFSVIRVNGCVKKKSYKSKWLR
jgi:hypothetical protein